MHKLFEDIFDDIHIDNEKDREIHTEQSPDSNLFIIRISFNKTDDSTIDSTFKRLLHFITNSPSFIDTSIERVYMKIIKEPSHNIPHFSKSLYGFQLETDIITKDKITSAIPFIYGEIHFISTLGFRSGREIYNMANSLIVNGDDSIPKTIMYCYPTHNDYPDIVRFNKDIIDGNPTDMILLERNSSGDIYNLYQIDNFYFTYIDNTRLLTQLKSIIEKNNTQDKWTALYKSNNIPQT